MTTASNPNPSLLNDHDNSMESRIFEENVAVHKDRTSSNAHSVPKITRPQPNIGMMSLEWYQRCNLKFVNISSGQSL